MKHILIIGKYYPPAFGGVERYTREVAVLAAKTYRVTVLVHNFGRDDRLEKDGNITVLRCGMARTFSSQPISPSMLSHLRSLKPDLVHFNAPNFWAAAMLLLAGYTGPLIVTHHADVFGRSVLRRAVIPIYHRLVRRATCVVVNSLKNATASKDLPQTTVPFVEIPHGVKQEPYQRADTAQASTAAERRQRFNDMPVVGFVGRFVRYKGIPILIEALSRLEGVHAILIGDGPLRPQLAWQVGEAGMEKRVHFAGELDEPTKIHEMGLMDVLILPSTDTTEAFGVSQIEAQLLGLPVIVSSLPTGVTDVTIDNVTGLTVPPGNAVALANAISRLIGDRDLAKRLGDAGRERALRLFTLDHFDRRFAELFDRVLSGQSIGDLAHPFIDAHQTGDHTITAL